MHRKWNYFNSAINACCKWRKTGLDIMTPAINILKKNHVLFSLHNYDHNTNENNYGKEASILLGIEEEIIYKTLILQEPNSSNHIVAILPVNRQLNLKLAALHSGVKSLSMMLPENAQRVTGYLIGAISPIGQKKKGIIMLDSNAIDKKIIFVSGGKRGLEVSLDPNTLAKLIGAKLCAITINNINEDKT